MGTVEMFDHTADVGLRVTADDLTDLFRTAAEGLFDYVVANRSEVRPETEEAVSLEGDSPDDLLIAWLNELIFRSETRHMLYTRFDIAVSDDGRTLQGVMAGEKIDPDRHELDHEVKAVTRHGLSVTSGDSGWSAKVILDI